MPTYDYQCFACNHVFEEFQKITADPIKICPVCKEEKVKRLVSATSFHLKGGGWYASGYSSTKTDSSSSKTNSSVAKKSDSASSSKKTEAVKPATKKETSSS